MRNYDLCLRLYTECAEVNLVQGFNDEAIRVVKAVLDNGKCVHDKVRCYHTLIIATMAQGNIRDAIQIGLAVFEQLGESFPVDPRDADVKRELENTHKLIELSTVDSILQRKPLTDANKSAAMRRLVPTGLNCQFSNQKLMMLLVIRMIQISIADGLTSESSFAFGVYAFISLGLGNRDLASFCGKVALCEYLVNFFFKIL